MKKLSPSNRLKKKNALKKPKLKRRIIEINDSVNLDDNDIIVKELNPDGTEKVLESQDLKVYGEVTIKEIRKSDGKVLSFFKDHNVVLNKGRRIMIDLISGRGDPNAGILAVQVGDDGAIGNGNKSSAKPTDVKRESLYHSLFFRIHNESLRPIDDSNTIDYVSTVDRTKYANEVPYLNSASFVAVKYKMVTGDATKEEDNRATIDYKFIIDPVDLNQGEIAPDGSSLNPNPACGFNELGFIYGTLDNTKTTNGFYQLQNPTLITHFTMATRPQDAGSIYEITYTFGIA